MARFQIAMGRYTVRSKEGQLSFESFLDVEKAYLQGLVDADDEVLEEGKETWRKAGSIPLLQQAATAARQRGSNTVLYWVVAATLLAAGALFCLIAGYHIVALCLAMALTMLLWRVTALAFKRK